MKIMKASGLAVRDGITLEADRRLRFTLPGVFLLLFLHYFGYAGFGYKYIRNFDRKEYSQHPQNWAITQDERGIIYIGNNGCLMEYDGVNWRSYTVPGWSVRCIAIGADGNIYIGGKEQIGYFNANKKGELVYVSLMKHLDKADRKCNIVGNALVLEEGIYFRAKYHLFLWDYKGFKTWRCNGDRFDSAGIMYQRFYVRDKGRGLMVANDGTLQTAPGGEALAKSRIYVTATHPGGKYLLAGRSGCFLYDGISIVPFPTQLDGYFKQNKLYHGIRLKNGDYAMATLKGGLVIMDTDGVMKKRFDMSSGLQNHKVWCVHEDHGKNLWLGLDYGLAKIEYDSPFEILDQRCDAPRNVLSVVRKGKQLYAGSNSGLFVMPKPDDKFRLIKKVSSACWDLILIDETLLAATDQGVLGINGDLSYRNVTHDKSFILTPSSFHPNRIWAGCEGSVRALERDAQSESWKESFEILTDKLSIRTLVEENEQRLWLGPYTRNVLKVELKGDNEKNTITPYDESCGLPGREIRVFKAAGHVIFASEKGIYRFDESTDSFIGDDMLGSRFKGGNGQIVFQLAEDSAGTIWFHSLGWNYRAVPQPGGTTPYRIDEVPFRRMAQLQANAITCDGNHIWLATNDEIYLFHADYKKDYLPDFNTSIRQLSVKNGPVVFGGNNVRDWSPPVLPHARRNLRFDFAALFFEGERGIQYRWKLEGYDQEWSPWTPETMVNYTNLAAGTYSLKVVSRNIYHHQSKETVFPFSVLPPWYLTWWMYTVYAVFLSLLFRGAVKLRSRKLVKEKEKLERTVTERTNEIEKKNLRLQEQTIQLQEQSEKLQEMAQVKSRFFANISHEFRTPLTLIIGPLEKKLKEAGTDKQKREYSIMLRNAQRLLGLINQLLDLSRLDNGRLNLQTAYHDIIPFLKGVTAAFEIAASQKDIQLRFNAPEQAVPLCFDSERMEEIFCNLMSNAFKFTPKGGQITLTIRLVENPGEERKRFVEVSIKDTGTGIPRHQLEHIFDRFYQAGTTGNLNKHNGAGIGLSLTRELVNLHGGAIDVHSTEGEGCEFIVHLPLDNEPSGAMEKIDASRDDSETCPHERALQAVTTLTNDQEQASVDTGGQTDNEEEKIIVLVVDDNADIRHYIRDALEPRFAVEEAADGAEGIQKAEKIIPDLIVSDIMMPVVDGYQLCRALKKNVKTSHIPIILLTAKASEDSVVEGLDTGADDYITKPFSTRILCSRVNNLIELRRQLQERYQRRMMLQPEEIMVSSVDQEFMKELQGVVEKKLSDPEFNVRHLREKLIMSRATLYRKVRALTGESPQEFIRSYRLKRGAQLLRDNYGNVGQVAFEVGFSSSAYFTQRFKEKFHQLPSEYQQAGDEPE